MMRLLGVGQCLVHAYSAHHEHIFRNHLHKDSFFGPAAASWKLKGVGS